MGKFINLSGKVFGRWTVICREGQDNRGKFFWRCVCECKNEGIVRGDILKSGKSKSCGCLKVPYDQEYIEKLKQRLLKYSHQKGECRIWNVENRKNPFGYGLINIRKKYMGAHRASWIAWRGEIPEGMFVLHVCDIPECINPDHLWLGTQKENIQDMDKKKRRVLNYKTMFKKK